MSPVVAFPAVPTAPANVHCYGWAFFWYYLSDERQSPDEIRPSIAYWRDHSAGVFFASA
jgi:hypothetical protein